MPEGTFSVDFYGDTGEKTYVRTFFNMLKTAVSQLEEAKVTLRPEPFYFTRCTNCECVILTNREAGKEIACHECKHEDRTRELRDSELQPTLERVNELFRQVTSNPFFWKLVV